MPLLSIHETSVAGYGRWDAFMRLYICWRWQGAGYTKLLLFGPICNLTAIQAKNLRKSCKKELLISEIFSIDKKCVYQAQKITELWVWSACTVSIEKKISKMSIFSSDLWGYWAYTGFLLRQCPITVEFMWNSVIYDAKSIEKIISPEPTNSKNLGLSNYFHSSRENLWLKSWISSWFAAKLCSGRQ